MCVCVYVCVCVCSFEIDLYIYTHLPHGSQNIKKTLLNHMQEMPVRLTHSQSNFKHLHVM